MYIGTIFIYRYYTMFDCRKKQLVIWNLSNWHKIYLWILYKSFQKCWLHRWYILVHEYYMMFQMYLYYIIIFYTSIYIHYNYIWSPANSFPNFETCVGDWNRGQRQRRTGGRHQGSRNPITAPEVQLCSVETFWICQRLVEKNGITHLWGVFFSTYRFVLCDYVFF